MADIEKEVDIWDRTMKSVPTFEEFRDVEYVRQSSKINMITEGLVGELQRVQRWDGVAWVLRCKEHGVSWIKHWSSAMNSFEAKHGPKETWFPDELRDRWQDEELAAEMRILEGKMKSLQKIRKNRGKCKV